jgi:hypothetical protein
MVNYTKYISIPAIVIFTMGALVYCVAHTMLEPMVEYYGGSSIEMFTLMAGGHFMVVGIVVWLMDIAANNQSVEPTEEL